MDPTSHDGRLASAVTTTAETRPRRCRYETAAFVASLVGDTRRFCWAAPSGCRAKGERMLQLALLFLVIGIVAGVVGFTTIAVVSFAIANSLPAVPAPVHRLPDLAMQESAGNE